MRTSIDNKSKVECSLSESKPVETKKIARYEQQQAAPQSADVCIERANLYARQQQWQLAIENYLQAISLKPNLAVAHRNLSIAYGKQDNSHLAVDHLFRAFKLEPDSFTESSLFDLAQNLEAQKKTLRAIACYRHIAESKPDFEPAYQALSSLLLEQDKDEAAIDLYRQRVNRHPKNIKYILALASVLAERQKWQRASHNYRRAAKIKPTAKIHYHWGIARYKLEEYQQARSHFQKAAKLKPSAEIYYYWGLAHWQLKATKPAESCWQKAIALNPKYVLPLHQLGKLWQSQKKWQQAISAYQKVISIDPEFTPVLLDLGQIYRIFKKFEPSISCYRHAIETTQEDSPLEEQAVAGYQQTLECYPTVTAAAYYQFGRLLRARGSFPKAIEAYIHSLQLDPNFKNNYIDLQYTPIAKELYPKLIEVYRQIVAEHPEITVAWGNLADVLTQEDRFDEAIECYRKGSYQQAIQTYPALAKLDWQPQKTSGPDFIIAGASKCGTSSIYHYLSRHPQILLPHKKEIDFYWQHYERGIDWYLAHFPTISDRSDFLTGEATPNYLRFPQVAQRIKDTFPQTKIILLLRNPVDRAISWHYHKLNSGLTNVDLSTAIAMEIERLATVSEAEITNTGYYNPDNIMSSLYYYKIKPWIETLGREQFLILKSEDFYLNPIDNMERVFEFLGLPGCTLKHYPKVNAGSYSDVDPQIKQTLSDYFAPYNRQLEEYLGIEFGWDN